MSLKRDTYLKKLVHDLSDDDLRKDLLNYYIEALTRLNENGGYAYKLVFVNPKKEAQKDLPGNVWTLKRDNLSSIFRGVEPDDESFQPYVLTAKVQPGSVDLEDSLTAFAKCPEEEEVVFLQEPSPETVTRFSPPLFEQQEEGNPEQRKQDRFRRNLMDDDTLKKYFGRNPLAVAKYIIKQGMIDLWLRYRKVGRHYVDDYRYNNTFPIPAVTAHLYDIILKTDPNKLEYVNDEFVEFISLDYFAQYIPEATDIVQYMKQHGIYNYIVEYGLYKYSAAKPEIMIDLCRTKQIEPKELAKDVAKDEAYYKYLYEEDAEKFGEFLEQYGLFEYLTDPTMDVDGDVYDVIVKYCLSKQRYELVTSLAVAVLQDVQVVDGKIYWILDELSELAEFFDNEEAVSEILGGEYHYESYGDSVYDFEDNCVENLDAESRKDVIEYILKHHEGEVVDTFDQDFEGLMDRTEGDDEDGDDDAYPVKLTREVVTQIVLDDSLLNTLLTGVDELDEVKSEMERCYNNAYDSALESEVVEAVWKEVRNEFGDPKEYNTGRKKKVYHKGYENGFYEYDETKWRIDITGTFLGKIKDYFDMDWRENLTYNGSLRHVLKELQDGSLSFSWPDYVWDDKTLKEYYNENIRDCMG